MVLDKAQNIKIRLRRVKTDKAIIRDLPDKVEAIQYCNLSKEQAALYESVVRDVEYPSGLRTQVRHPRHPGERFKTLIQLNRETVMD